MNSSFPPKITAVISTYHRPRLVRRAILSVLNQTYPHVIASVSDDASGDETRAVVTELARKDPRVEYHAHSTNQGMIANVISGMRRVTTPFFTLLSDDNVLLPDFYETALKKFDQYPEAMFSATPMIFMTEEGRIHTVTLNDWKEGLYTPPQGILSLIRDPSIMEGAVFRRDVLDRVGTLELGTGQVSDWDFVFRISARFPFAVTPRPGILFLRDPSAYSLIQASEYSWPRWQKLIQHLSAEGVLAPESREAVMAALHKRLRRMLIQQGKLSVVAGKFEDAHRAASTLRTYFRSLGPALTLKGLASLCKAIPPLRTLYVRHHEKRTRRKARKTQQNYQSYESYARFLKIPDEGAGLPARKEELE